MWCFSPHKTSCVNYMLTGSPRGFNSKTGPPGLETLAPYLGMVPTLNSPRVLPKGAPWGSRFTTARKPGAGLCNAEWTSGPDSPRAVAGLGEQQEMHFRALPAGVGNSGADSQLHPAAVGFSDPHGILCRDLEGSEAT